jgi:hypothetical protein
MQDMDATYVDLDNVRGLDFLYHELGDTIAFFD